MSIFFTRKWTKHKNTQSQPFLYDTKMAADSLLLGAQKHYNTERASLRKCIKFSTYWLKFVLRFFNSILLQQTIKCLLIVPNAESALNEEAGKLLLERYDDYSQRAQMMTDIHAKQSKVESSKQSRNDMEILQGKKRAGDKVVDKKKKDKKRALKRL